MKIIEKKGDGTYMEYTPDEFAFWSSSSNYSGPDWLFYVLIGGIIVCIIILLIASYA